MTLVKKLIPDSQIFQQDPEGWSDEQLADAAARLRALVTKHRTARGLSMEVVEEKTKPKRTRKKADGSTTPAQQDT